MYNNMLQMIEYMNECLYKYSYDCTSILMSVQLRLQGDSTCKIIPIYVTDIPMSALVSKYC